MYIPKCASLARVFTAIVQVYTQIRLLNSRIPGNCPCLYASTLSQLVYLRRLSEYAAIHKYAYITLVLEALVLVYAQVNVNESPLRCPLHVHIIFTQMF
jgi:hypothetical protein